MKAVARISAIVLPFCLVLYFSYLKNVGYFFSSFNLSTSLYSMNATSSQLLTDNRPVHDKHYELRKALKEAATEDKTVILTTLNDAWAEPNSLFDLFLESFRIGNNTARLLDHVLVIAIDEKAFKQCRSSVRHCYFFKGKHSSEEANEARFKTPIFVEMMWERQALLRTVLTLGYNFVFTDTDVMWLRDPFPHFYPEADFQTSSDGFNGNTTDLNNFPNTGFIFVRSNNRSIELYNFWIGSSWRRPRWNEQELLNFIKHDPYLKKIGLKYRFLDTDYFGGRCSPSKDFNNVCTMHANCCVGMGWKIAYLKTILEDWKMYLSDQTTNQTSFRGTARCGP